MPDNIQAPRRPSATLAGQRHTGGERPHSQQPSDQTNVITMIEANRRGLAEVKRAVSQLESEIRQLQNSLKQNTSDTEYSRLIQRIQQLVEVAVPIDATVAVISKGDNRLLNLQGRNAWHFPQTSDGSYAGHYPEDSSQAISQLNSLRHKGATHLLIPNTSLWWLDHYQKLKQHLSQHHRLVTYQEDVCVIYDLADTPVTRRGE